jgi:hypothetical protein
MEVRKRRVESKRYIDGGSSDIGVMCRRRESRLRLFQSFPWIHQAHSYPSLSSKFLIDPGFRQQFWCHLWGGSQES